jgi:phenylalanyl-tRNA synthetase beta chain
MMSVHDVSGDSQQASEIFDVRNFDNQEYLDQSLHGTLVLQGSFVNDRLGLNLSDDEICTLLHNVHFAAYSSEEDGGLSLTAPFWRTDIELPEDIVEEVGRLYGFDKLPRELPRRSIRPAARNKVFQLKQALRGGLSRLGANEVLTYSFVHENILKRAGQDAGKAFRLGNALSPDLQYYRVSLLPSLLDKVHPNLKAGYDSFAMFELGKSHLVGEHDDDGLPLEFQGLSFVYAAKQAKQGAPYYPAREYLSRLLSHSHVDQKISFKPLSEAKYEDDARLSQLAAPFEPGRSAVVTTVDGQIWGVVGEFKAGVRKAFKLPEYVAGFETDLLTFVGGANTSDYMPLPKYPKVWQDITLRVPAGLRYDQLFACVESSLKQQEADTMRSSLSPVDIFQREDDSENKHVTLRYSVASYDKTMTDGEVAGMLDAAAAAAKDTFGAERI